MLKKWRRGGEYFLILPPQIKQILDCNNCMKIQNKLVQTLSPLHYYYAIINNRFTFLISSTGLTLLEFQIKTSKIYSRRAGQVESKR